VTAYMRRLSHQDARVDYEHIGDAFLDLAA
jgi:hypothetical protein